MTTKGASGDVWVILDVDRTLFNTTSWYRACTRPGLLLQTDQIKRFELLNEQTYGALPTLTEKEFRQLTLDMLNEEPMTPRRLYDAGVAIAAHLRLYPEVLAYLTYLRRKTERSVRVLFLSAGYTEFISGVVDGLLGRHQLGGLGHTVVGSTLTLVEGVATMTEILDHRGKERVIRAMLAGGDAIAVLADDSYHHGPMFDAVSAQGGVALRIVHEPHAMSSRTWREFLQRQHPELIAEHDLRTGSAPYAMVDTSSILGQYPEAFRNLPPTDNQIGVGVIPAADFALAVDRLCGETERTADAVRLRDLIDQLIVRDGRRVWLRGRFFYLGAPPYLFPGPQTSRERWCLAIDTALECTRLLDRSGFFVSWTTQPATVRWVVLAVVDHLKNAVTLALDVLVRATIDGPGVDLLDAELERLIADCHAAYWSLVFNRPQVDVSGRVDEWQRLRRSMKWAANIPFATRELDDPYVTALSVMSLIERFLAADRWPTGVVAFASGALDLGLAFQSITAQLQPKRPPVGVVQMAFSSKDASRGLSVPAESSHNYLLSRMTAGHRARLEDWLGGDDPILLYDNNVTTFSTLKYVKDSFAGHCLAPIQAIVACVNYDNLRRHLDDEPCEPLCEGWASVLDHPPVADYVTAFATWGSSAKTEELDRIFRRPLDMPAVPAAKPGQNLMFKLCRVHNSFDLVSAVQAGANLFGIHVVSPEYPEYSLSQQRHRPEFLTREEVPGGLPHFEVEAIRMMARHIPEHVRAVVVMEHAPTAVGWRRVLTRLGLVAETSLQLQCRVHEHHLRALRGAVTGGFICAVGADQDDLVDYHRFLDELLDPVTDLVLVDYSSHQPDLIGRPAVDPAARRSMPELVGVLRENRVPVLLADDCPPWLLLDRCRQLRAAGVRIAGIDTQNSVEVAKTAQRYRAVRGPVAAQVLVRKSPDLLAEWTIALAAEPALMYDNERKDYI